MSTRLTNFFRGLLKADYNDLTGGVKMQGENRLICHRVVTHDLKQAMSGTSNAEGESKRQSMMPAAEATAAAVKSAAMMAATAKTSAVMMAATAKQAA